MTAFVSFVRVYGVWIYLLCALGILIGIKMLTDARRLARTTLFSLEQERANEQSYRGVILIFVTVFAVGAVTAVNLIGSALVPTQEPPILRGATPTLPAFIFATNTPLPTFTRTALPPTETPFVTTVPITPTITRAPKPASPVLSPTPTPGLPAPTIVGPVPNGVVVTGEGQMNNNLVFRWTWTCEQCTLGSNDRFVVVVSYVDKSTGVTKSFGGGTQSNFLSLGDIVRSGFDVYQKAQSDSYQWYVQVKRGDQPLSPPSDTWKFVWH